MAWPKPAFAAAISIEWVFFWVINSLIWRSVMCRRSTLRSLPQSRLKRSEMADSYAAVDS